MAQCEDLPLYRDCGKLLTQLLPLTQSFPRFYKHTLGGRMVDLCLDMLSLLYRINSSRDKLGLLAEFIDRYRMLQMLFRTCVEMKIMSERRYAPFALLLTSIGRQATGWRQKYLPHGGGTE